MGGSIEGRLSLTNSRYEPVIEVPSFGGVQTDTPADLGQVKVELFR